MTDHRPTLATTCRVCRGRRTIQVGDAKGSRTGLTCPHCRGTGQAAR